MRFTQAQFHSSSTDYAHWPRRPVRPTKHHAELFRSAFKGCLAGSTFDAAIWFNAYLSTHAKGNR